LCTHVWWLHTHVSCSQSRQLCAMCYATPTGLHCSAVTRECHRCAHALVGPEEGATEGVSTGSVQPQCRPVCWTHGSAHVVLAACHSHGWLPQHVWAPACCIDLLVTTSGIPDLPGGCTRLGLWSWSTMTATALTLGTTPWVTVATGWGNAALAHAQSAGLTGALLGHEPGP
jgi:hypothetical protein